MTLECEDHGNNAGAKFEKIKYCNLMSLLTVQINFNSRQSTSDKQVEDTNSGETVAITK